MNLKTRIYLLPAIAAGILAVAVAIVGWYASDVSSQIRSAGVVKYPHLDASTRLVTQVEAVVAAVQSAVAEGNADGLDDAVQKQKAALSTVAAIKALEGQAEVASRIETELNTFGTVAIEAAKIMLGKAEGDQAAAIPKMQAAQKVLYGTLEKNLVQARTALDEELDQSRAGVQAMVVAFGAGALLIVVSLGVGSWLLARSVWRDIGGEPTYAREVLTHIASGDLSVEVRVDARDQQSLLASLREMREGLARIVTSVRSGTDSMSVAAREIAAGNLDLSQRTEQTASNLQQTASSVQELSGTARQTADAARSASQLASSAAEVAGRGGQVVAQVVATMDEINVASRRIADIIGTIDGIAFQTNILALNAAVEAARAGEQGRGFAVVAAEVRSLAQRSADAAREIKGLIGSSVDKVENGARLVGDAGTTMSEIVASVQRVNDIIGEISAAAGEQSSGIGLVNGSVTELDRMTQQNASLVEQSAAAAQSMNDQAAQLVQAVSSFRLAATAHAAV